MFSDLYSSDSICLQIILHIGYRKIMPVIPCAAQYILLAFIFGGVYQLIKPYVVSPDRPPPLW